MIRKSEASVVKFFLEIKYFDCHLKRLGKCLKRLFSFSDNLIKNTKIDCLLNDESAALSDELKLLSKNIESTADRLNEDVKRFATIYREIAEKRLK